MAAIRFHYSLTLRVHLELGTAPARSEIVELAFCGAFSGLYQGKGFRRTNTKEAMPN